ncbi:MAG: hypothetical protein M5U32_11705 [Myxococcota bacterium]|nr:hypothetical protein [Myxococcota bacterium]
MEVAEKLVGLSRADWKYADLYARAAEGAMASLCTREQFQGLLGQRTRVKQLILELQRAIRRGDWTESEELAEQGRELRTRIERDHRLLSLGEVIYGRRSLDPHATALALAGVVAQPARVLEREITRLSSDLRTLAGMDSLQSGFYERRAAEFDRMIVDLPEDPPARVDPTEQREAALDAADGGDFGAVLRVARNAARSGRDRTGRIRAPRPSSAWVARLVEPIPADAVERARWLGLEPAALEPNEAFNAYSSCSCADRAVLPAFPLSEERRELEACTCGHACPPNVGKSLKNSLDALMVHPFLTSGGTRYLPWFGAEAVLVESFPEGEPDARTPLLESLSLPRRRGLTRLALEDALLSKGPVLCEDLGLDPTAYRLTCVPFDVYERLANRYGWGMQELWTHFDGYQLTRELELQALVGGDVRYGGADDLCGVGRGYDSDHITARFAIVRRDRFEAREPHEAE